MENCSARTILRTVQCCVHIQADRFNFGPILDNLRQYECSGCCCKGGRECVIPRIVGGRVFHFECPRKLNDLHPNLEGV